MLTYMEYSVAYLLVRLRHWSSVSEFSIVGSLWQSGVQNVGFEVEEEEWKIDHVGDGGGELSIIMTKAKANW